ncbi:MAG TPA: PfkB family carbohydrate kinase [Acidobacteriota bacterium]|jgi:sugar/nucleoside kinase (ribokinase family)|nr:PfkB family carbohydrate kinase [Acidobacteriota bacterium]
MTVSIPFSPAADKLFDVVGVGANSVDWVCVLPQFPRFDSKLPLKEVHQLGGGEVATALTVCSRFGLRTKYIGKTGNDANGVFTRQDLQAERIDLGSVVEADCRNQFAIILVDEKTGERTVLSHRPREIFFKDGDLRRNDVCQGRLLHVDGTDQRAALRAAQWAREEGIPVTIDIDRVDTFTGELIRSVDFLITAGHFPSDYLGISDRDKAIRTLSEEIVGGFLCCTLGAEGAVVCYMGQLLRFPAYPVNAVDTTGAGDVFRGAFIYALFQRWPLEQTIRFANAVAGLSCERLGARGGIRTMDEVVEFMERQLYL